MQRKFLNAKQKRPLRSKHAILSRHSKAVKSIKMLYWPDSSKALCYWVILIRLDLFAFLLPNYFTYNAPVGSRKPNFNRRSMFDRIRITCFKTYYQLDSRNYLRNKKLCHMRYLLFWDISSADPGMLILSQKILRFIGRPHGATILDRIMKNETANPTSPPTLPFQIMDETAAFSHPCLEGRRYKFPIYFVQTSKTTWRKT